MGGGGGGGGQKFNMKPAKYSAKQYDLGVKERSLGKTVLSDSELG